VIRLLDLKPHPEGGHFRETFRDARTIDGKRAASAATYFLLACGERSHWHRVDGAEVWHFYAGAPLLLRVGDAKTNIRLGPDLATGEQPQAIVPPGTWQSGGKPGRLDVGGLHGRARLRILRLRARSKRLVASFALAVMPSVARHWRKAWSR
jgi:predicted cupin superfamily sugar epimerase